MSVHAPVLWNDKGDCFVVLSENGHYWNGEGWVQKWQEARQFDGPSDPSAECELLADDMRRLGCRCSVAYIPRTKIAVAKLPDRNSERKVGGDELAIKPPTAN